MKNKFICIDNAGNGRYKIGKLYDLKARLGCVNDIFVEGVTFKIAEDKYEKFIDNNYPIFRRLNINEEVCPECDGYGLVDGLDGFGYGGVSLEECDKCDGNGYLTLR